MSNFFKIAFALLVVSVVIVGCAPQATAPTAAEKTVTIGILGALTGPLRSIGEGAVCIQDYFTDLNETEGGIKYKDPQTGKEEVVRVKILMGDHGWDAAKCRSLYERFKGEGMQFVFCNGSGPAAALYTVAARDKIPGINVVTTCDPFIYELPKPYIAIDAATLSHTDGPIIEYLAKLWKDSGKTTKPKIAMIAADVSTRRVLEKPELGFPDHATRILGDKLDYLGISFIPQAPVDVKAELAKWVEKDVDILCVEHWGSSACRVVMNDALALEMHKKGIWLDIFWLPPDVPLSEPELFDEYNTSSRVMCNSHGYNGNESAETQAKVPGLKKAFDLCAKYHNGQTPYQRGAWYYVYGVGSSMVFEQAVKAELEKNGYAGMTTEGLRDQLFAIDPVETGGLQPTYQPDPNLWGTWYAMRVHDIKNGNMITNWDDTWVDMGPSKVYPNFKHSYETPSKYGYTIWQPTPWTP